MKIRVRKSQRKILEPVVHRLTVTTHGIFRAMEMNDLATSNLRKMITELCPGALHLNHPPEGDWYFVLPDKKPAKKKPIRSRHYKGGHK